MRNTFSYDADKEVKLAQKSHQIFFVEEFWYLQDDFFM
jgi:hypothetical protein